ncbi:MAG: ABC transporter permease [Halioglobus sp.]
MLALVVIMPLLTLYANLLGILGGGIVAGGMGIAPIQYLTQSEAALGAARCGGSPQGPGVRRTHCRGRMPCRHKLRPQFSRGWAGGHRRWLPPSSDCTDAAINILFQHIGL